MPIDDGSAAAAAPRLEGQGPLPIIMDGRRRRSMMSRHRILEACRTLMKGGQFRPSMDKVCDLAERERRTGFDHFGTIEALHLEASEDAETAAQIIDFLFGREFWPDCKHRRAIVRAVVLGRV